MSILETFRDAIPSNLYTGFLIKIDTLPDTPVDCVYLELMVNPNSTKYFGQKDTINYPLLAMTVRSSSYQAGYDVANAIRNYFDMYADTNFLGIYANGNVASLGKDTQGNRRFRVQFTIISKE